MMQGERKKLLSLDAKCQNNIMSHFQSYSLTLNKKAHGQRFYELKLEITMLKQLHDYVNHYQLFCEEFLRDGFAVSLAHRYLQRGLQKLCLTKTDSDFMDVCMSKCVYARARESVSASPVCISMSICEDVTSLAVNICEDMHTVFMHSSQMRLTANVLLRLRVMLFYDWFSKEKIITLISKLALFSSSNDSNKILSSKQNSKDIIISLYFCKISEEFQHNTLQKTHNNNNHI